MSAGPDFAWEEATLAGLATAFVDGALTARALTEAYLERIGSLDAAGPELRSVIETNPDALAIADTLDAERRDGHVRGPLHGIPILVKDNLDTADAMRTTAGSLALEGARPRRDAPVVERLRAAGVVLLGKTNMSEWANFRSTRASSGWSARGGQCRNPYALDRSAVRISAPVPASRSRRASAPRPSAPRPTGRSSARPRSPGSSGSSRRSASSRPPASCRSPTRRTPRARWRARSAMRPPCLAARSRRAPWTGAT